MQVYTSAKVIDKTHPRKGEVGTILSADDPVEIRFADNVTETIPAKSLQGL